MLTSNTRLNALTIFLLSLATMGAQTVFRPVKNEKSDVVFAGVDNPLTITIPGVSSQNIQLIPSFGEIRRDSGDRFLWKICHLDSSRATLVVKDVVKNRVLDTAIFKVKMIPPPEFKLLLNDSIDSLPRNADFCPRQKGIVPLVQNFPFDVKCEMLSFQVEYFPINASNVVKSNQYAGFNPGVLELVNSAKPGDKYIFSKFRFSCGCDETIRHSPEKLTFLIK